MFLSGSIIRNSGVLSVLCVQVVQYKGWGQMYVPHSELAHLVHTPWQSAFFNATTVGQLVQGLDLDLEADAGYTYEPALKWFLNEPVPT